MLIITRFAVDISNTRVSGSIICALIPALVFYLGRSIIARS